MRPDRPLPDNVRRLVAEGFGQRDFTVAEHTGDFRRGPTGRRTLPRAQGQEQRRIDPIDIMDASRYPVVSRRKGKMFPTSTKSFALILSATGLTLRDCNRMILPSWAKLNDRLAPPAGPI